MSEKDMNEFIELISGADSFASMTSLISQWMTRQEDPENISLAGAFLAIVKKCQQISENAEVEFARNIVPKPK